MCLFFKIKTHILHLCRSFLYEDTTLHDSQCCITKCYLSSFAYDNINLAIDLHDVHIHINIKTN